MNTISEAFECILIKLGTNDAIDEKVSPIYSAGQRLQ